MISFQPVYNIQYDYNPKEGINNIITGAHHSYINTIAYPIYKFTTSQTRLNCHSASQPTYKSLSVRSVPAGKFQTTSYIFSQNG